MYIVHVSSTKNQFVGTGFMGVKVSSFEELKNTIIKYATFAKDGERYWYEEIKIEFNLESTLEAFKRAGNKQCEEVGFVDIFRMSALLKQDPLSKYSIIFRPSKWIKDGKEFKLILLEGRDKITPFEGKLKDLISNIGITF